MFGMHRKPRFRKLACVGLIGLNPSTTQMKAVCVEAGMLALRREATLIKHEDFMEAIAVVAAKKKGSLDYYS